MAKGQDNGTTILLGLKDYKVGEVKEGERKVVVKSLFLLLSYPHRTIACFVISG